MLDKTENEKRNMEDKRTRKRKMRKGGQVIPLAQTGVHRSTLFEFKNDEEPEHKMSLC